MGEQYIDLFAAGAYAVLARLYGALSAHALDWLFLVLAASGLLFAIWESAEQGWPDYWLKHLAAIALSAVLTLLPCHVDLPSLTYAAPGQIEALAGSSTGAAPPLTFAIERVGAAAAGALRQWTRQQAVLTVPGVSAQVGQRLADPALLNDRQLKANLEIWRQHVAAQVLNDDPTLGAQIRAQGLEDLWLAPTPDLPALAGADLASRSSRLAALLAGSRVDLPNLLGAQAPLNNDIADLVGAQAWTVDTSGSASVTITFAERSPATADAADASTAAPGYADAVGRGDAVARALQGAMPDATSARQISTVAQLYDALARSVYYAAGVSLAASPSDKALLGSLCQRRGDTACHTAFAALTRTQLQLRVPPADPYNTSGWLTWFEQPIATLLLTVTSALLYSLSSLVVSVLPFALGTAKAMAILISAIGAWMLLWPGRARLALSWMMAPIAFVSIWSVLFNLWADIEPLLGAIASIVGNADESSWSAGRAMSIAISMGYLGLPSLALGLVYGESGRALYHASARLESALLTAWHTRSSISAFTRRWVVNSPLARRWNQRAYRAVGLGTLPRTRTGSAAPRRRQSGSGPASGR